MVIALPAVPGLSQARHGHKHAVTLGHNRKNSRPDKAKYELRIRKSNSDEGLLKSIGNAVYIVGQRIDFSYVGLWYCRGVSRATLLSIVAPWVSESSCTDLMQ